MPVALTVLRSKYGLRRTTDGRPSLALRTQLVLLHIYHDPQEERGAFVRIGDVDKTAGVQAPRAVPDCLIQHIALSRINTRGSPPARGSQTEQCGTAPSNLRDGSIHNPKANPDHRRSENSPSPSRDKQSCLVQKKSNTQSKGNQLSRPGPSLASPALVSSHCFPPPSLKIHNPRYPPPRLFC